MKKIIIGKSGSGKSYVAIDELGDLTKHNTVVVANGCCGKETYENIFPYLKEYESVNIEKTFKVEDGHKYFLDGAKIEQARMGETMVGFVDALAFGCGYGMLGHDKKATILFDDGSWQNYQKNRLLVLWRLSHLDCNIIITADSLLDILGVESYELSTEMIEDVLQYWDYYEVQKGSAPTLVDDATQIRETYK